MPQYGLTTGKKLRLSCRFEPSGHNPYVMSKTLQEIVAEISCIVLKSKLLNDTDTELAADLLLELLDRKGTRNLQRGQIADLYSRVIDLLCQFNRSPTYDGQEIESLLTRKEPIVQ